MNRIISIIIFIIGPLMMFSACALGSEKSQKEGVEIVSPSQLHQMMEEKDFVLVNVHVPYEGEIPETDLLIPYDEILENQDKLPAKEEKMVLYCRSDHMSTIAAEKLANTGYTNIYNLKGGMIAWKKAGYMLIARE